MITNEQIWFWIEKDKATFLLGIQIVAIIVINNEQIGVWIGKEIVAYIFGQSQVEINAFILGGRDRFDFVGQFFFFFFL